jgi:VCBS repeat-containing protein
VDDTATMDEDGGLNVAAPGVLGNDTDVEGDPLTAVLVDDVANGTLVLNADGSFTYTPDTDWNGVDTFTYRANDGTDDSNLATVTITVNPVNDAPVAADDAYPCNEDDGLIAFAPGVLANDSDVEGDPLTAVLVDDVANGVLVFNANGSFTYTPNADWNGTDTFTYRANDGTANSNLATVTIIVSPLNDAPAFAGAPIVYNMAEDTVLNVPAPGLLAFAADPDGDPLTVQLVTDTADGALTLNADGSFTFSPNLDFSGVVTFVVRASDGTLVTADKTVTIQVAELNGAGDLHLFLGKMKGTVNWAKHAAGTAADTLSLSGKINPRGANPGVPGAQVEIRINGALLLPAVALAAGGSASGTVGGVTYKYKFDWLRGTYSFALKGLDLRAALGLANATGAGETPVTIHLSIAGGGLDVPLAAGVFLSPFKTTAGKASAVTFSSKANRSLSGVFQSNKAGVKEAAGATHTVTVSGVIVAEGGGAVVPNGDITVKLGDAELVIPFAAMTGGTKWSYKGAAPGITKFVLDNGKRTFSLTAAVVAGTGIPVAGPGAATVHPLDIGLDVPTGAGPMSFQSTVEILRTSATATSWKR